MMKVFRYFCDFTKSLHYLVVGSVEELNQWEVEKFKTEPTPMNPNFAACHYTLTKKNGVHIASVIWMPEMNFQIDQYVTLSHECLHAAIKCMHQRGMDIIVGDNSEQLNYLHDAIYGAFLERLNSARKKDELDK